MDEKTTQDEPTQQAQTVPDEPAAPPTPTADESASGLADSIDQLVDAVWRLALRGSRTFGILLFFPWRAGEALAADRHTTHQRYLSPMVLLTLATLLATGLEQFVGSGGNVFGRSVDILQSTVAGELSRAIPSMLGAALALAGLSWLGARLLLRPGKARDEAVSVLIHTFSFATIVQVVFAGMDERRDALLLGMLFVLVWPPAVLIGYLRRHSERRLAAYAVAVVLPLVAVFSTGVGAMTGPLGWETVVPPPTIKGRAISVARMQPEGQCSGRLLLRNMSVENVIVENLVVILENDRGEVIHILEAVPEEDDPEGGAFIALSVEDRSRVVEVRGEIQVDPSKWFQTTAGRCTEIPARMVAMVNEVDRAHDVDVRLAPFRVCQAEK